MKYVVLHKEVGKTPLQAIQEWKKEHAVYAPLPASYAGRLDPMASGKLLVLLGEECKKQKAYTGLDKEYEIEVLLGVGSDTGDALGIVSLGTPPHMEDIHKALRSEVGAFERAYPAFSSKTVNGKPLFLYALEGALESITTPTHQEQIYNVRCVRTETLDTVALQERIETFLHKVPKTTEPSKELGADFRIKEVQASWEQALHTKQSFTILTLHVTCASGTYMRTLAQRIGNKCGSQGIALSIARTRIGKYWKGFWIRQY